jgi:hypothetical protein
MESHLFSDICWKYVPDSIIIVYDDDRNMHFHAKVLFRNPGKCIINSLGFLPFLVSLLSFLASLRIGDNFYIVTRIDKMSVCSLLSIG